MRRLGTPLVAVVVGALALVGAACTDAPGAGPTEAGETPGADATSPSPSSVVTAAIVEPATLLPLDAGEPSELAVVRALFTGLVTYDPETAEAEPAVATSITSDDDGATWRIVLEDGWTFHDGTPVTARSFVDAWNHGAYGPNQWRNREVFREIRGFEAVQCGTTEATVQDVEAGAAEAVGDPLPDCEGAPPPREQLSGLEVVSEREFTVELAQPVASWPQHLGHPAMAPLPPAFFEDPQGFADRPVGNGPFRLTGTGRTDDTIGTTAYPDHAGDRPQVPGLDFRVHADPDAALDALVAGEADVMTDVPPERWPEAQSRMAHSQAVPSSALNYLGFPVDDAPYDDPDLRAALSMAIDRELLTDTLFEGLRSPATSILPEVVPGHQDEVCPAWQFDPEGARERFEEAGGLDGPITVWFNADGGHQPWLEAVVRQWSAHLGIDASQVHFEERPFPEYLDLAGEGGITGPFRMGWDMTHPDPGDYLRALLHSRSRPPEGAVSTGYASDEVDAALDRAATTTDRDDALELYQEALAEACEDVPVVPVFHGTRAVAWSDAVDDVRLGPLGTLDYTHLRTS